MSAGERNCLSEGTLCNLEYVQSDKISKLIILFSDRESWQSNHSPCLCNCSPHFSSTAAINKNHTVISTRRMGTRLVQSIYLCHNDSNLYSHVWKCQPSQHKSLGWNGRFSQQIGQNRSVTGDSNNVNDYWGSTNNTRRLQTTHPDEWQSLLAVFNYTCVHLSRRVWICAVNKITDEDNGTKYLYFSDRFLFDRFMPDILLFFWWIFLILSWIFYVQIIFIVYFYLFFRYSSSFYNCYRYRIFSTFLFRYFTNLWSQIIIIVPNF